MNSFAKKNKALREQKYKFNNYTKIQKVENKSLNFCSKCRSNLGANKIVYATKIIALQNIDSSVPLHPYSCPFGNGWHLTSNKNFKRNNVLYKDYKRSLIKVFINDEEVLLKLNKKNSSLKELIDQENIKSMSILTFWKENKSFKKNLELHNLLKSNLDNLSYRYFESEIYKDRNSEDPLHGFCVVDSASKKIIPMLKKENIFFLHYISCDGILRFKGI